MRVLESTLKRKDVLTPDTTRTDLEDIMLSEISQTQKTNTVCPLIGGSEGKFIETESRGSNLGPGSGEWGVSAEYLLELRRGGGCRDGWR